MQVLTALTLSMIASIMDIAEGKVRNQWIIFGYLAAAMLYLSGYNHGEVWLYVVGAIIPIVMLMPLFVFRMLGPGDIKLFSVLGAIIGIQKIIQCIILSFILGGILSLGILLLYGNISSRFRYFTTYFQKTKLNRIIEPYYRKENRLENIHFTVPILMSVVLYAGGYY